MQRHIKNYLSYFNYKLQEDCSCSICGSTQSLDIHHIYHRSKSQPELDEVWNLICLCRHHHEQAHANILTKEYLTGIQQFVMENR